MKKEAKTKLASFGAWLTLSRMAEKLLVLCAGQEAAKKAGIKRESGLTFLVMTFRPKENVLAHFDYRVIRGFASFCFLEVTESLGPRRSLRTTVYQSGWERSFYLGQYGLRLNFTSADEPNQGSWLTQMAFVRQDEEIFSAGTKRGFCAGWKNILADGEWPEMKNFIRKKAADSASLSSLDHSGVILSAIRLSGIMEKIGEAERSRRKKTKKGGQDGKRKRLAK